MAATPFYRPFVRDDDGSLKWYQRLNGKWLLQRIPMVLLGLVSAYGVQEFMVLQGTPPPFNWLGGAAFDVGFLGVIALTDDRRTSSIWSQVWFYVINVTMAAIAAIFNILAHSGGKFSDITPESITVGAPFALFGLAYAIYYHSSTQEHIILEEERRKARFCEWCGYKGNTQQAIYAHYRFCAEKNSGAAKKYTNEGKQL
jgi:hypothetical protein